MNKKLLLIGMIFLTLGQNVSATVAVDYFENLEDESGTNPELEGFNISSDPAVIFSSSTFARSGVNSLRIDPGTTLIYADTHGAGINAAEISVYDASGDYTLMVIYDTSGKVLASWDWDGTLVRDNLGGTIASGCGQRPYLLRVENFNPSANTFSATITNDDDVVCYSGTRPYFDNTADYFQRWGFDPKSGGFVYVDDMASEAVFFEPPEGVGGNVVEITGGDVEVFIQFRLSPDDANQEAGSFSYQVYRSDGVTTSLVTTTSPGDAIEGVVSLETTFTGSGDWDFYVRVSDVPRSLFSCSITLNTNSETSSDSCGSIAPPQVSGGSLFGDDGLFYGGDKAGYADSWKLTEAALDMMYGVILVFLFAGIAYKVSGGSAGVAIGGAAGGLLFAFAFGLFTVWVGVFVLATGLGVAFVRRRMGGPMDG